MLTRSLPGASARCGTLLTCIPAFAVLLGGGCPRPEDTLEQNDSAGQATSLIPGQALNGRVVQGDPDFFIVDVGDGVQALRFDLRTVAKEEENCAAFRVFDPNGVVLYSDVSATCSRDLEPQIAVQGAAIVHEPGVGFTLTIPVDGPGAYVLEIRELGYADNVFTYSWQYAISVSSE